MKPTSTLARALGSIRFDTDETGFGQEALAELLDNVPVALAVTMGPEQRYVFANRLVRQFFGGRGPTIIGRSSREVMGEFTSSDIWAKRQRVIEHGEPQEISGVAIPAGPGGELTFWDMRLIPVLDDDGKPEGILTIGVDVTAELQARAEAENQAREAEYHNQRLALAIEATELGLWEWDARTGQTFWSDRQKEVWGLPKDAPATYEYWRDAIHPDDRETVVGAVGALMDPASGGQLRLEHRIVVDGEIRWVLSRGQMFYGSVDGETKALRLLGTVLDITDRKRAEEERQLLVRELNHRVKNLFAVASGMVSLTARSAATPAEMGRALRGRLEALARAHDLIQPVIAGESVESRAAPMDDLVRAVLAPYESEGQIAVSGPSLPIATNAATALTLVLHELATNAAKYGALSNHGGRLAIDWRSDGQTLVLNWTEEGGPPIAAAPASEGFGSQLARKSITGQLGGAVAHDWRPEGLRIAITLPVLRLQR